MCDVCNGKFDMEFIDGKSASMACRTCNLDICIGCFKKMIW